ncbi:hypothetical protein OAH62_01495 [Candidatus Marinimicrobia bacterium]|nr:hypothetical protein [Candidatus Neomarinimicrobiota bacterium]
MRYLFIALLTILISDTNSKWEESDKELELIKESLKNIPIEKKELPMWEVSQYVDDYGDPSGNFYVNNSTLFEGKFTNSAVSNAKLLVKVLFHKRHMDFILYEYGNNIVKDNNTPNYKIGLKHNGTIIFKSGFNKIPECMGKMTTDRIRVKGRKYKKLLKIFKEGGDLKFHIRHQSYGYESEYRFALLDLDGSKIEQKLSTLNK